MTIIWIDGTFGVGKTAVSNKLVKLLNHSQLLEFDAIASKYPLTFPQDFLGKRYPESKNHLIDSLIEEISRVEPEQCSFLVIPIALITDYCEDKLINGFKTIKMMHIILYADTQTLEYRITNQEGRDVDLARTYSRDAISYLNNHYEDAIRIDTTNKTIDEIAFIIKELCLQ